MAGIGLSICIVRHVAEKWTTLLENDENNDNGSMLGGYNRTRSIYTQFWLLIQMFQSDKLSDANMMSLAIQQTQF